jgi:hypothetical protein
MIRISRRLRGSPMNWRAQPLNQSSRTPPAAGQRSLVRVRSYFEGRSTTMSVTRRTLIEMPNDRYSM